jgi:ABC-type uncharacterized transport system substrate-binding protein
VSFKPDLLLVAGQQPTLALKAATTTVPIVFAGAADPVGLGLASSLAHARNLTGYPMLKLHDLRHGVAMEVLEEDSQH